METLPLTTVWSSELKILLLHEPYGVGRKILTALPDYSHLLLIYHTYRWKNRSKIKCHSILKFLSILLWKVNPGLNNESSVNHRYKKPKTKTTIKTKLSLCNFPKYGHNSSRNSAINRILEVSLNSSWTSLSFIRDRKMFNIKTKQ